MCGSEYAFHVINISRYQHFQDQHALVKINNTLCEETFVGKCINKTLCDETFVGMRRGCETYVRELCHKSLSFTKKKNIM